MLRKSRLFIFFLILCAISMSCNQITSPRSQEAPELVPSPIVESESTSLPTNVQEPTIESILDPEVDLRKGQIIFKINGNIWYQNLETGEVNQLTDDANEKNDFTHIYTTTRFSESGQYLAYEYGYSEDGSTVVYVLDLMTMEKIAQLDGEMIIGWRDSEDVLLVGHNSELCGDRDLSTVNNDDVSFIISALDANDRTTSQFKTLPGGYRIPLGLSGNDNRMVFMPCPCDAYECHWAREVFSEEGNELSYEQEITSGHSSDGRYLISVFYSIHQPDTTPLIIKDLQSGTSKEIYLEEGKFVTSAIWSPRDEWVVFWLGDVASVNYQSNAMLIRSDGSGVKEITPTPKEIVGWFPDGRLILFPKTQDQIILYDLEYGELETLVYLDQNLGISSFQWHTLP